jgi:serine-type D-Ala-D-Ala carboxypeptidase/endopeptidase
VIWRAGVVDHLVEALTPTLPSSAFVAAVAADAGGYAVRLSDDCPIDGRFEIGSITKTMTGAVLAALADDGVVGLDDEVGRWLSAGRNSDITLAQLATHSSGLPRLSPGHSRGASDPYAFLTADAAERDLRAARPRPRGVDWDYSNFGFQVLSLALERAAGMPFASLLEERIFRPLGMSCSGITGQGRGHRVQGHTQGSPVRTWTHHLWGAGGVESSAEDMARYLAASITPPDSAAGRAIRGAEQPRYQIDPLRSAGLGWVLGPPGYLGHDGGTSGFRAMLGIKQSAGRGAAVFVNDKAAGGLALAVRRSLDREADDD